MNRFVELQDPQALASALGVLKRSDALRLKGFQHRSALTFEVTSGTIARISIIIFSAALAVLSFRVIETEALEKVKLNKIINEIN